ncbi:MAG TPA: fumarylacetoacetate hydrolase family protein [Burkholderiales bacterium]|nr:fumarylacetoacetate hydrolase family protein [Burkholderiales bacterium]
MRRKPELQHEKAARWLFEAHERRDPYRPIPPHLAPASAGDAYAIQDAFVAMRAQQLGGIVGYKIALSTPAMQAFVGVGSPQAGCLLQSTVQRSPGLVRAADYGRLIVEFEVGVRLGDDLPAADAPFTRERVAKAVQSVMPALEIADDRCADYALLRSHPLDLIADNAWNEGAVLGEASGAWRQLDLAAVRGRAEINGAAVGEGTGADALGHPFDAVAWVADHLSALGRGLLRGDVVITGSLVTSKVVAAGDRVAFHLDGIGSVELSVQ